MIILGGLLTANGACTKTGKSSGLVSTQGRKSILLCLTTDNYFTHKVSKK